MLKYAIAAEHWDSVKMVIADLAHEQQLQMRKNDAGFYERAEKFKNVQIYVKNSKEIE